MAAGRGADLLIEQAIADGFDTVFGVPGIQIMTAYDALYARRDRIRTITTRHEQSCAYMAYGYAQASGRPGLMLLVPGPGLLNATSGIGLGYAANAPLVAIAGQIPRAAINKHQGHLHEIVDQLDCVRPIAKSVARAMEAKDIPAVLHQAVVDAISPRMRPTVIDIPPEALAEQADVPILSMARPAVPQPDPQAIEAAAAVLRSGSRPALFIGGGAASSGASKEVLELAERLDAPIITTQNAKGIVDENNERVIGVSYFKGLGPGYKVLPEADVILAVGTRFFIRGLNLRTDQKLVQIDVDPTAIGRNHPAAAGVVGDARASLRALLEATSDVRRPAHGRAEEIRSARLAFQEEVLSLAPLGVEIIRAMRAALPEDTIVVSGMNYIGYWSHLAYPVPALRRYITPGFFGALGYAFPTALGAKVACPARPVIAVCGDGGFMFAAEELATAVQFGINVVVLLFNNDSFGASEYDQQALFQKRIHGTKLQNPDFLALARAFGVEAKKTDPGELGGALAWGIGLGRPCLIECRIPNMMPPFTLVR